MYVYIYIVSGVPCIIHRKRPASRGGGTGFFSVNEFPRYPRFYCIFLCYEHDFVLSRLCRTIVLNRKSCNASFEARTDARAGTINLFLILFWVWLFHALAYPLTVNHDREIRDLIHSCVKQIETVFAIDTRGNFQLLGSRCSGARRIEFVEIKLNPCNFLFLFQSLNPKEFSTMKICRARCSNKGDSSSASFSSSFFFLFFYSRTRLLSSNGVSPRSKTTIRVFGWRLIHYCKVADIYIKNRNIT